MLRLLRVRSPYVLQRHPIFQYETRRVRWAWSSARLWAYTRAIVIIMHLAALVMWLLLVGIWWLASADNIYRDDDVIAVSLLIVNLGMTLGIFAGAILDFLSLLAALNSISGEKIAGRWDLLRLTALTEHGIIRAKHETIRLRVWRYTSILAGSRMALITLGLVIVIGLPYVVYGYNVTLEDILFSLSEDPISVALIAVIVVIMLAVYVVEPFWRMRGMTALGMVLSAYISNIPMATLAAVGTILAVWILQTIIVVALVWGLFTLGSVAVLAPLFYYSETAFPIFAYLLFCCIVAALTVYGFYYIMQTWSLRRVLHRLNKLN